MENDRTGPPSPPVSPEEARRTLGAVAEIEATTSWRPSRWALILLSAFFAVAVTGFAWDNFWLGFGVLAVMGVLLVVLRRHLFNPYIRQRPWQSPELEGELSCKEQWIRGGLPVWIPLTILVPAELSWLGVLVGLAAGAHLYYAAREFEATR